MGDRTAPIDGTGKIRVAVLCDLPLHAGVRHGNAIYVSELIARLLRRDDLDLHVITIGDTTETIRQDGLTVHLIRKGGLLSVPYFHPLIFREMQRTVGALKPDLVHALSTHYPYSTLAALLRDRYPTLVTAFGVLSREIPYYRTDMTPFHRLLSYVFHSLFILNERYVLSSVPDIVVDTESIQEMIHADQAAVHVVPAGLDLRKVQSMPPPDSPRESPDFIFVNTLNRLKGADVLISALSVVASEIPTVQAYIGGMGPQEGELKRYVRSLGLEKNVTFLGYISEEEKCHYYRCSRAVIVPSRWDCQPSPLFEAAALGTPVIASDMSNPGIIEDGITGLVFSSENAADLAEKMLLILRTDGAGERMGAAARAGIVRYDWGPVSERYVQIYRHAIDRYARDR